MIVHSGPPSRDKNDVERPSESAALNADGVWQETFSLSGVQLENDSGLPPGSFWMGSADSDPKVHPEAWEPPLEPCELEGLWLGRTTVTRRQFAAVMDVSPPVIRDPDGELPVDNLSVRDCERFVEKLKAVAGKGWCVPSEARWEKACRCGSKGKWWFGDDERLLGNYAWYQANSGGVVHPVGQLEPSPWGLYDMYGNVQECVRGCGRLYEHETTDPDHMGPDTHGWKGGSYRHFADDCRSASRQREPWHKEYMAGGLRLWLDPDWPF